MHNTSSAPQDPLAGRIMAHLHKLSVEIGPRYGGSPGNHAAARYIETVMQACGLAVTLDELACPAWEERETTLKVNGVSLPAIANGFSQPCDVTAPAVALGTIARLQAADLTGKVAILYGELASDVVMPKSWFLKSAKDETIVRLLEEKAPLAVVAVQPRLGELEGIFIDAEFLIPSATVAARTGLALLRAENPTIHLRIDTHSAPGWTWNISGRKPGAGPNRIIVCAHYDSVVGGPGALDNGGGVSVMLELARRLSHADLDASLEFIAFTNEDSAMPVGSITYVAGQAAQLGNIVAVINIDGVGHALDVSTVSMMAESQPFHSLVDGVKQEYPDMIWTEPWPESDHSSFAMQGVPALALTSRAERYIAHLRSDSIEWASPARLSELVGFATELIERMQDKPPAWTRSAA